MLCLQAERTRSPIPSSRLILVTIVMLTMTAATHSAEQPPGFGEYPSTDGRPRGNLSGQPTTPVTPLPPTTTLPPRGPAPPRSNPETQRYPSTPQNSQRQAARQRQPQHRVARPKVDLFEPAQLIARVGDQPIFLGDLLGNVNQVLEPYKGKVPDSELEKQREMLVKQLLKMTVDNKLLYLDFLRTVPEPDKLPDIMKSIYAQFDEKQLSVVMEKAKVKNPAELDTFLRKYGSSLQKTKRDFAEQVLGQEMLRRNGGDESEVTHQDMLDYYNENLKDYAVPSKARWEHLMVRFDRFNNEQEARRAIAQMGDRVYLGGAPLRAVARESSHGLRAKQGGQYDWTTKGSLASKELDKAIFTYPVDRLSPIIRDKSGLHIVRVLERKEATYVPFEEAQVGIKKKIQAERVRKKRVKYIESLKKEIDVWTVFDSENDDSPSAGARVSSRPNADPRRTQPRDGGTSPSRINNGGGTFRP